MRASLKRPVVVLVLAAAGVGACKKKTAEPANTTTLPAPPAAPASAPMAVTTVNLGKSLGADKRVTSETTTFGPRDTIYASVATSGNTGGTLAARWTFQDGQVVDETSQTVGATGPAVTEFHVSKPSGWPTGNYKVEVMLNGAPAQSKEFRVQ
ncbi:MAG: hypothetical protein ACJ8GN_29515 [Longimicrobiaceae bacterium]